MRSQVWIHDETGVIFHRQSEYLEYMRDRRIDRQSKARLIKARTAALERLRAIYEVNRFDEIAEFLNDNKYDLEMACRTRDENSGMSRLVKPISIKINQEYYDCWSVGVKFGFDWAPQSDRSIREQIRAVELSARRPMVHDRSWCEFDIDSITDVLEALGFKMRGGGGSCGNLDYHMEIMKSRFPSVVVMERLAAA